APVFSGQLISVSPPVSIQPGQSAKCTVVVRNTGNQTWKQNGQSMVALGTTNPQDRIPGFVREDTVTHQPSGWVTPNRVSLQQSEVPPNGTGTFEFWYSAPQGMSPGSYQEAFNLVADGQSPGWFQGLSIVWPVTVSPPPAASIHDYVAEFVGESGFLTLQPGQTGTVWFKFRNKGTAVWKQSGQYVVRLGTRNPDNRPSTFFMSGWLEPSHPCMLQEPEVPSGQIGTFSFQVTAPNTPGQYEEHFAPVVDGLGWVEGLPPVFTTITVQPPPGYVDPDASHYHAQYITQNPYPTLRRGEAYRFQVQLRNNGTATWIREKVNLGTDRPQDRVPGFVRESADGSPSGWISPNRIVMQEQQVPPGGTATFVFYMRVPDSMAPGSYQEYFRLVADGITWMEDIGIYWTITVAP
ncbi:MAG: hypothetical protein M1536_02805, partial [Firmicutes bacterium]|nr:hypothetical protein [Bacillota bacterium]